MDNAENVEDVEDVMWLMWLPWTTSMTFTTWSVGLSVEISFLAAIGALYVIMSVGLLVGLLVGPLVRRQRVLKLLTKFISDM